tara:strand:- start:3178 stop:3426 length:249 start_codon:yes stop_codon:yes gene_type:complete
MLDKQKFVEASYIPKDLLKLSKYAENLQLLVAWLSLYLETHKKLNVRQHDWVKLETAKECGVDIDELLKSHKSLLEELNKYV